MNHLKNFESNYTYSKCSVVSNMIEPHYHHHYEIYYLLSNTQKYFINNETYEIEQGTFVVIKPGELHKTFYNIKATRIVLNFNDIFINKYLSNSASKILLSFFEKKLIVPTQTNSKTAIEILENMETKVYNKDDDGVFYCLLKLFIILCESKSICNITKKKEIPILNLALNYIDKNYIYIKSLSEVADHIKISKYYLCKLFSKNLGISFNNYLIKIRIKKAEDLLEHSTHSISRISDECGFSTVSYFCKIFKETHTLSPLKYRSLAMKNKVNSSNRTF